MNDQTLMLFLRFDTCVKRQNYERETLYVKEHWATRTPPITDSDSRCSEGQRDSMKLISICGTHRVDHGKFYLCMYHYIKIHAIGWQ